MAQRNGSGAEHVAWLARAFEAIPARKEFVTPSEWAEKHRYLPPSVTPMPGHFRFAVTPYLREIVDCFSVDSPIREAALMKGVQVSATTGVLENVIGYAMAHIGTAPMMMVTADDDLAKLRMDSYIIPMLQSSDLMHLVQSADEGNSRKTGKTAKKLEWEGGGWLVPQGAKSAAGMRSASVEFLLRDEVDAFPLIVGKDGDPIALTEGRTKAYHSRRKILDLSTPTLKGLSIIHKRFIRGDQRYYYIRCLSCGFPQVLRWRVTNNETGEVSGIVWETENNVLVPDSVRYLCQNCGHAHVNEDKTRLLAPEHGAEWRPTATAVAPDVRSYHLSALYSPVGMQPWSACVAAWLEAWDEGAGRPKSLEKLQVVYNNVFAEPFEPRGEKLQKHHVLPHRRSQYSFGQVPNKFATDFCGGPVGLVTCAVDVHASNLAVAVMGWTRDCRGILIDYWRLEGDTEQSDDPGTWQALGQIVEETEYLADDGRKYRIPIVLIDGRYKKPQVHEFCCKYSSGVYPVAGQAESQQGSSASKRLFTAHTNHPNGVVTYTINVDPYKDLWAAALKRGWNGVDLQPAPFFNAPENATDAQLLELTKERKMQIKDPKTGELKGYEWVRPSGADNELWDLLVYNRAALDITAWDLFKNQLGRDLDWHEFWDRAEAGAYLAG